MDIRVKTFTAEATSRFDRVLEGLGFTGPEVDQRQDICPLILSVRYRRSDVTIETALILAYAGEEYVHTRLRWAQESPNRNRCVEMDNVTAHTGYQMRRALDRHAQTLSELLKHSGQGD
ncbi:hypothetical protein [Streptomyces cylindrosporus]|uniref:Uncharacterized protein n=1 Tax=Streptomyces cylindrosporus TaxID=2927583 RepID=A0ABS9Y5H7_9ACTN|nr:hypothetical protein [Streptomyces cylindrosporus]MCI3272475.1 hypothetical protein [Streptomyces cylindrosporus]